MGEDVDESVMDHSLLTEGESNQHQQTQNDINHHHQADQQANTQHKQTLSSVTQEHHAVTPVTSGQATYIQQASDAAHRQRVRQYSDTIIGPFTVIIREARMRMAPLNFASYINKKYKSVSLIKRSQGKMKVILEKREEANALARDPYFVNYHIYIPADLAEIDGALCADDLCDMDDLQFLISSGKGVFGNMLLPSCNIVYAEQIVRVVGEAPEQLERIETNTVKVTFAGQILPSHVVIGGLRVKVRPFHRKPMFCDTCESFGHTSKYCRGKPKCANCSEAHATSNCTANPAGSKCPYCLTEHQNGRRECSFFNEVNESFKVRQANRRKTRYEQAVAAATRTNNVAANAAYVLEDTAQFPILHNSFSTLPVEETPQQGPPPLQPQPPASPQHPPPTKPRTLNNPYAKVVREGSRPSVRARSASKRKWSELQNKMPQVQPSTPRMSRRLETVEHATRAPGLTANPSPTQALKIAIITFARHANVSQMWITLLEAIIDPLLQALLPQLTAIIGSLGPTVLSSTNQHA